MFRVPGIGLAELPILVKVLCSVRVFAGVRSV